MKILLTILMVYAAGMLCGIPIAWAVNAKLSIFLTIPFALLMIVGLASGAYLIFPR